ncbi:Gfo/Idh/MocA family protein [Thermoactinomyces sp. CICC 23799]|jgi:predicted dehydrogenase|uniref:Gfo/Idh/MocA family protein n=1 Tax=Thermoactinomyces sp. CICC 23799 TaxID=2767429 RepID=UPI0018DDD6CD|nr:Gfo/Idh/MocA family oxidoreductase [Thermoactinomyces sp. CICC 23799]MBH8601384.1 Gfo/Idh/MocA family oxidoreductase [Thermoactinomyces sp. CICC 23799]
MASFKIGFIGAGSQALEQMKTIHFSRLGTLAAVCDPNIGRAIQAGRTYQIPYFSSYQNMIAQTDLDAVFICTPHNSHFAAASYALTHQLHVIKEKPFACTVTEGQELVELARRNQKSLITVMQRRYHECYQTGKELLKSIGDPFFFRGSYSFNGGPYDFGWRGIKSIAGGGAILDMGYHMIDLIIWYLGLPTQVYAQMSNIARPDVSYETEDTATLSFRINHQLIGTLDLTRASQPKEEQIYVHATKGTLYANRYNLIIYNLDGSVRTHVKINQDWSVSIQKQIDHFIENALNGKIDDGSSHLPHLHLVEAAYRSSQLGEPVFVYTNPFWLAGHARKAK